MPTLPIGQGIAFMAPLSQKKPAVHGSQSSGRLRSVAFENLPAGHGVGATAPSWQYEPGLQTLQATCLVPGAQSRGCFDLSGQNVPGPQSRQLTIDVANRPRMLACSFLLYATSVETLLYVPAGHAVSAADSSGQKVPAWHGTGLTLLPYLTHGTTISRGKANKAGPCGQSAAALRFVVLEHGGVHSKRATAHFNSAAKKTLEEGVRNQHVPIRDQQRSHRRASGEPAPRALTYAAKATTCYFDRCLDHAALDDNLPVELQAL
eukprot:scaffold76565_cov61-Phaeocystis_antarctica.AAC.2